MISQGRTFAVMLLVTVLAAGIAGWGGVQFGLHESEHSSDLDAMLHSDLGLTADQDNRLDKLESNFARDRAGLQDEMRAANRDLAHAITNDNNFDVGAGRAIDRFHVAMRALQEKTVQHVLAMRALLTPAQAKIFDKTIDDALGAGAP
jgi:Spy/CpxP family protein refolding chaperone